MTDWLKKYKVHIFLLLIIAGVISVPLMQKGVPAGTNLQGSLSRIEAVKEGIGNVFPIRMIPMESLDYGYGAASFQADVFYLIPALFRLMGMGIGLSYKLFLLLLNLSTAVIAYACFYRMFGRTELGLVGSMLYTWCPYRCADMYVNANLGETVAWTFIPIVILGLAQLYGMTGEEKRYAGSWVTLTWGFSLLALSSSTFFLVAAGATLVFYIVMGRRSLHRQILVCTGKAFLATLAVNGWFLVPMLLRMRDASAVGILIYENFRMHGMYLTQYLSLFPQAGSVLDFSGNGIAHAQAMGAGAAVVILVFVYLWSLFVRKFADDFGKKVLCTIAIVMILSFNLFPWDLLQNRNMIFSVILALLQSPAKWGVTACAGLIWVACRVLQKLSESGEEKLYVRILPAVVAVSFGTTQYLINGLLRERGTIIPDGEGWNVIPMQILTGESPAWRLCEVVSVVAVCGLLVLWMVRRKKGVERV